MLYITKCIRLIKPVNNKVGKFVPMAQQVNIFPPKTDEKFPSYIAAIARNQFSTSWAIQIQYPSPLYTNYLPLIDIGVFSIKLAMISVQNAKLIYL